MDRRPSITQIIWNGLNLVAAIALIALALLILYAGVRATVC